MKRKYFYGARGLVATIVPNAQSGSGTQYATTDSLGSPRIVTNSAAAVVSRHDYMPFGEELGFGVGGRTTGMGYGAADGIRKKFTGYERDTETGLDYAQARYFSSAQGRFTSPDPLLASAYALNPQTWNRFSYVVNNPLKFVDPSGMIMGQSKEGHSGDISVYDGTQCTRGTFYGLRESDVAQYEAADEAMKETLEEQPRLIQDDPDTIQGESNTKDCSLTVSFKLGTFYENNQNWPNGPSAVTQNGISYSGLGFTWSGTVKGGNGVGQIGYYQNSDNPKGQWVMEQWTSSYATSRGEIMTIQGRRQSGGDAWMDIDLKGIHSAARNSRNFSRYDHPVIRGHGLFKNQSFFVKVSNGNKACYAAFHIIQRGDTIHWGKGATGVWPN